MKIQQAAAKAGQDVKSFCNENYKAFEVRDHPQNIFSLANHLDKNLAKRAEVSSNHFIRTSEPDHRFAVQHFWVCLQPFGSHTS